MAGGVPSWAEWGPSDGEAQEGRGDSVPLPDGSPRDERDDTDDETGWGGSTGLILEQEVVIVAFRHALLPLDNCLYGLQPSIPGLTRSSTCCPQRHGVSR